MNRFSLHLICAILSVNSLFSAFAVNLAPSVDNSAENTGRIQFDGLFTRDTMNLIGSFLIESIQNKYSMIAELPNGLTIIALNQRDKLNLDLTSNAQIQFFDVNGEATTAGRGSLERQEISLIIGYPLFGHWILSGGLGLTQNRTYYELYEYDILTFLSSPLMPAETREFVESLGLLDITDGKEHTSMAPLFYFGTGVKFNDYNKIYIQPGITTENTGETPRIDTIKLEMQFGDKSNGFLFNVERRELGVRVNQLTGDYDFSNANMENIDTIRETASRFGNLVLSSLDANSEIFFGIKNVAKIGFGFNASYRFDFAKGSVYVRSNISDKFQFEIGYKSLFTYLLVPDISIVLDSNLYYDSSLSDVSFKTLQDGVYYNGYLYIDAGPKIHLNDGFIGTRGKMYFQGKNNFGYKDGKIIGGGFFFGGEVDAPDTLSPKFGIDFSILEAKESAKPDAAVRGVLTLRF